MIRSVNRALPAIPAMLMILAVLLPGPAAAQGGITLPPSGDNQKASVSQHVGLVRLTVDYSSPDVHAPDGTDRTGKIWGGLVPYGMTDLGIGSCGDQCPWRGGANENTVFTTSHDIKVEGQALPAGSYGLHFIPGEQEWTVIFSKNSTSWGSYFYDPKEDALRVQVKPAKSEYHEWLTYEFTDRRPDRATVALKWENLQVPFTIAVDNAVDLYLENMRRELRSSAAFSWQGWHDAAQYSLRNKTNLAEALTWAERAASPPFGQPSFTTLATLARLQEANGRTDEARKTMEQALAHPTAGPFEIHGFARQLQAEQKNEEAMRVFEMNARKHPGVWPVDFGLARGYAGLGRTQEALAQARKAMAQAPDEGGKQAVQGFINQLEGGR